MSIILTQDEEKIKKAPDPINPRCNHEVNTFCRKQSPEVFVVSSGLLTDFICKKADDETSHMVWGIICFSHTPL